MEEAMDVNSPAEEEENERKLLADSTDDENNVNEKIENENEVLESDSEEEIENMESDKGNHDKYDSDDSNDSDDQINANEAAIRVIEIALAQNPYDYEAHKNLIEILHRMGELDKLRVARENMSSKFPLTSEIWLSWLRDEMKLAVTTEQKLNVMDLCEKAVQDYLSVEVWLEYLQFSTGLGAEKEITEKIRNIFEKALTATGLHIIKGALIWDAFREFENFIVLMMDSTDPEKIDQINRIGKLYRRQLACPLLNMHKTFEEYEIWKSSEGCECTEDEKIIKSGYEKALEQLKIRIPFEEKLEASSNKDEQFDTYKAYLMKEKQIGDPGRVTVLYERAVADLSLEPALWIDYVHYIQTNIKIDDITEKIYVRAVRNIPWSFQIWQNWIRFYEKKNASLADIQKLVENALAVGFSSATEYKNLWITYLEFLRRRIDEKLKKEEEEKRLEILRNAFNRALEHLETFGIEGDPSCEILHFWARTEAIHANNMEKARSIWVDIMSQGHSDSAASWLEYISLERCYGDTKHLRKLFQKALALVKDWPESIASAWINFERDEGTLEQMEICEAKIRETLKKKAAEKKIVEQSSSLNEEVLQNKKTTKRKAEDGGKWKNLGVTSIKVTKNEKSLKFVTNINSSDSNNGTKSKIEPPPGYDSEKKQISEEEVHNLHEVDDKMSIFVSNLDYSATEEDICEALKSVGPVTLFKMIKDYKGRSKGYCYIQLCSPQAVEEALKLDRTRVNGRPMFISRCDPNKTARGPIFKYKTDLEKNKLFIKGLSPDTTKEDLEKIFQIHGNLKDVRLVTYRNGHSKGLAYVDFEDEYSASKALVAMDGITIQDKVINVAISKPPQRKLKISPDSLQSDSQQTKSLGSSTTSRSHFGNPKTILSFTPRTVKLNITKNQDSLSGNGIAQPMKNEDFRNMLLNKK